MTITFPAKFLEKMKLLLKDDYDQFMSSYDHHRYYGVRMNPLKWSTDDFKRTVYDDELYKPIPWAPTGFYYDEKVRPGKHPYYHAGLYYIQEPSAMVPAELLDVQPGHRVLDLCAAPGGKSTQIAGKLNGFGLLVSNDISADRTKVLAKNLELEGIRNAVVLNESPDRLQEHFPHFFDRIVIDAPCSGEGMFRKNESMITEWNKHSVEKCCVMQKEILENVAAMLAPGGKLVYSTCTFSPEENEEQIAKFIVDYPEFSVVPIQSEWGWMDGQSQWIHEELASRMTKEQLQSIAGTVRLWPHLTKGEGHFVAVLQKEGAPRSIHHIHNQPSMSLQDVTWNLQQPASGKNGKEAALKKQNHFKKSKRSEKELKSNAKQELNLDISSVVTNMHDGTFNIQLKHAMKGMPFGNRLYLQPIDMPSLDGLKVIRAGWYIGELKSNKWLPSHALAMGITKEECNRVISFNSTSEEIDRYLKGETLFVDRDHLQLRDGVSTNGLVLICVDDYPVGFGKYIDGMIKNELPAGWRKV